MKVSAKCLSKVLAGGWDHDRLKGKSPGDIGSNPIREMAVMRHNVLFFPVPVSG